MDPDVAISIENVSKLYRLGVQEETAASVGAAMAGLLRTPFNNLRKLRSLTSFEDAHQGAETDDILWALREVSFQVKRGEVVGIIGSNGAGKSTLLKLLSRITRPNIGRIQLQGRVASLLEVGTGFHPDLSGRENVFLNGTILGMSRHEILRKFDEIVAFAEMERHIDTPTKRYSSGMRVRLAFAVAAHLEPEILLVDEVLAVGDQEFQRRCIGKMKDVASHGRTVLFVSHNISSIRALCQTGVYLKGGRMMYHGDVESAVKAYLGGLSMGGDAVWAAPAADPGTDVDPLQITRIAVEDAEGNIIDSHPYNEPYRVEFTVQNSRPVKGAYFTLHIHGKDQATVAFSREVQSAEAIPHRDAGTWRYRVALGAELLVPGNYTVSIHAMDAASGESLAQVQHVCPFELTDNGSLNAKVNLPWVGKVGTKAPWELVSS